MKTETDGNRMRNCNGNDRMGHLLKIQYFPLKRYDMTLWLDKIYVFERSIYTTTSFLVTIIDFTIRIQLFAFITARKRSWGKVIISQVSVHSGVSVRGSQRPPPCSGRADDKHPTGMHYCLISRSILTRKKALIPAGMTRTCLTLHTCVELRTVSCPKARLNLIMTLPGLKLKLFVKCVVKSISMRQL